MSKILKIRRGMVTKSYIRVPPVSSPRRTIEEKDEWSPCFAAVQLQILTHLICTVVIKEDKLPHTLKIVECHKLLNNQSLVSKHKTYGYCLGCIRFNQLPRPFLLL